MEFNKPISYEYNYGGNLSDEAFSEMIIKTDADEIILNKQEYARFAKIIYPYNLIVKIKIDNTVEDGYILFGKYPHIIGLMKRNKIKMAYLYY